MSEEEFKPIRITLSREAYDRMEKIMNDAKFRSYSSTVEECIRAIYDVMQEVYTIAGKPDDPRVYLDMRDSSDCLDRIIIRMSRLTGRSVVGRKRKK